MGAPVSIFANCFKDSPYMTIPADKTNERGFEAILCESSIQLYKDKIQELIKLPYWEHDLRYLKRQQRYWENRSKGDFTHADDIIMEWE